MIIYHLKVHRKIIVCGPSLEIIVIIIGIISSSRGSRKIIMMAVIVLLLAVVVITVSVDSDWLISSFQ